LLPIDEWARQKALDDTRILDSDPDPAFDRLVRLAGRVFGTDYSFISFIDNGRQWLKSSVGLEIKESPRDVSFCAHTILRNETMVVLDAREDERFHANPFVTAGPRLRFYAGAQVKSASGHNIGTFCVADRKPRTEFAECEDEILAILASLVAELVEAHGLNKKVSWIDKERKRRQNIFALAAMDGVWDWDLTNDSVFYSPRFQSLLGFEEMSFTGTSAHWLDRVHPDDKSALERSIESHLRGESRHFHSDHRVLHKDGSWLWISTRGLVQRGPLGSASRFTGTFVDITRAKRADPLTGLPNRAAFRSRLEALMQAPPQENPGTAVFFVDIDRFAKINGRFGPCTGDTVLKTIAARLSGSVETMRLNRKTMIARFAGDKFLLLVEGLDDPEEAHRIAQRIHQAAQLPLRHGAVDVRIEVSIGIVLTTAAEQDPDELLQHAELAMYQSKSAGRGGTTIFDQQMKAEALLKIQLESELRCAIEHDQLRVVYQPQIDLKTGEIVGLEALVRWQHPRLGLLEPRHFIPLAEEIGVIPEIDCWVLEHACRQVAKWRGMFRPLRDLSISSNISADKFSRRHFAQTVRRILRDVPLEASALSLEITETILMKDTELAAETMKELKEIGVGLHMDDFGTGYSSLKQLNDLPFTALKIDRCFVKQMLTDDGSSNIVRATIQLAKALGLSVIAEGIETEEQGRFLRDWGCDYAQGYYYSRPMDAGKIEELLKGEERVSGSKARAS
jgi:diguanylate cyclase (GGDEF)-like protein/PAS domain S-box-containing protein